MSLTKTIKGMKSGMLVTPRHEQWLKKSQGEVLVNDAISRFVTKELTTPQRDRRFTFSASGRGACLRQQMFSYLNMKGEKVFTSDQASVFIHGTWTHLKWQAMGLEAGWLAQVEVPCRVDEYNVTGTIDGVLDTGQGWELKSINSRGFREVCASGPLWKHLYQIHSYMLATGIRVWSLIYENKDTQDWREWVVEWNDEIAAELIEELQALKRSREQRVLPVVLPHCNLREGPQYRNCPFKDICLEMGTWPKSQGIRLR